MRSSCSGVMPLSRWLRGRLGGTDASLEYEDMRKDPEEVRLTGFFSRTHYGKKTMLENHSIIEMLRYLPSNAAATLLLRFWVASNALAVAAAEGGLLVLMVVPDLLQEER